MQSSPPSTRRITPFYRWSLLALNLLITGYLASLGLIPTFLSEELARHFHVPISAVSYSMTSYYYSLILFTIPVSLIIDRYSSQWIVALGILTTGLGAILFSQSSHLIMAIIARFLMGLGSTVGFVYGIKCIADWFEKKNFILLLAFFVSLQLFLTILGTLLLVKFLHMGTWQRVVFFYGLCSLPFACLIVFTVSSLKNYFSPRVETKNIQWSQEIRKLFDSSQVWFIGTSTGAFLGILFAFFNKWGIAFFHLAYGVSRVTAIYFIIFFCLGHFFGALFFAYISNSLGKRKMFIPWGILSSLLMLIIIIYPPYLSTNSVMLVFFFLGFASSASILGYVMLQEQTIPQLTASAIAAIVSFYAFAVAITDPLVSIFLKIEATTQGMSIYNLRNFQVSFFRVPIYIAVLLLLSFFISERRRLKASHTDHA